MSEDINLENDGVNEGEDGATEQPLPFNRYDPDTFVQDEFNDDISLEVLDDEEPDIEDEADEDPYLEEALSQGYNPDHEGDIVRSPREFVERGQFMKQNHALNQRVRDLEENTRNQDAMFEARVEAETKAALKSLKKEKRQAMEDRDFDLVEEIEDSMDEIREAAPAKAEPANNAPAPRISTEEANQFADAHKWMRTDKVAFNQAISFADGYAAENPYASSTEIMQETANMMKDMRPDLFKAKPAARNKPAAVNRKGRTTRTPTGSAGTPGSSTTFNDLNSIQARQCVLYTKAHKGKTAKDWINSYEKTYGKIDNS